VALAAGVLAGANALARSGDVSGAETFATTGTPGAISGGGRSSGSTTISGGGGATGGGGGGVATAVKSAEIANKAITGAFTDSQNTARLLAQGGGGFTDSQNAARLAAQGGITINVNAPSIIDEEGFSRATANALNNSTFRGTNGASNLVYL
jgi:hypothetical protein